MPRVAAESLIGIHLLRGLSTDARNQIANQCTYREYDAGTDIVVHGDASNDVFFLVAGLVRATIFSVSGKEVAFRDLVPGETFGDLSAIDGRERCASVIALAPCVTVTLGAKAFQSIYCQHPEVAQRVMEQLSRVIRALSERVLEHATMGVRDRVRAEVLRIAEQPDCDRFDGFRWAPRPPTHDDIAKRISTQREAVTKEISALRREGVLAICPHGGWLYTDLQTLRTSVASVKGEFFASM
ncbi:MAG: Crp/Fnr family transcriptional regulator [Pseudomonadota bacterium]